MMPSVYHKPSIYNTTISNVGQKRTFNNFQNRTNHEEAIPAFNTIEQGGFKRPSVPAHLPHALKAGSIRNVSEQTSGPSEYSQRKILALTPTPTSNPILSLAHPSYGLPERIVQNLAKLGINSIYPWQSECLLKSGALSGSRNLVYTAPTGGGKSLVADIIMLKRLIECPLKKALLVLPYVALVQEKLRWLRKVVEGITTPSPQGRENKVSTWVKRGDEDSVRVVGFFGGSKSKATWADMDIAVCTIEKANLLVNSAIEDFNVGKIGVVVIDELHMLDDGSRGYILELMATKLLCLEDQVQLIGMSATLNNSEVLAKWLGNARFYLSRYRPVPVEEHLVFENNVYPASTSKLFCKAATQLTSTHQIPSQSRVDPCRIIEPSRDKELKNAVINSVVSLANETARAGYGALVFCSSRAGAERDAELISRALTHQPSQKQADIQVIERRKDLLNDLRSTPTGLDQLLETTIPLGVSFHHAGLTTEERDLIATAYDQGTLKVITATCSLAAGINLPARRVILHGARMGVELVGPSMLRQMRGRAGRKGKDEIGETYLCCQQTDLEEVAELMGAEIPNVESCLNQGEQGAQRALLEIVAIKLATNSQTIDDYVGRTLLSQTTDAEEVKTAFQSALQDLLNMKLIEGQHDLYTATLLGQAIAASSLTPEDGIFIHKEMLKSLGAFVLDSDMHALYLFTPVQAPSVDINWQIFRRELDALDDSSLKVLSFVGLQPHMIHKMARGGSLNEETPEEIDAARRYRRFYTALQLRDLCNETPIHAVAKKYDIPRGSVQNLSQTCHGFAAGMIKFCGIMGWTALSSILDHFSDRLRAGAKADLLALAQIQFIKSKTARIFWENGFKTVGAIAAADVKDIMPILVQAQPKKLRIDDEQEKKYHAKLAMRADQIVKSANLLWEKQMREEIELEEEM